MARSVKNNPWNEVFALILLFVGTLLFLALISYTPKDVPSWVWFSHISPANHPAQNFIGPIGAIIAGICYHLIGAASYWNLAWDDLLAAEAHKAASLPGHAGRFETSLMLALREQLVNSDRPRRVAIADSDTKPYGAFRLERHGSWQEIDGYSDSPADGSAALGRKYVPILIAAVGRALADFYRANKTQSFR